MVISLIKPFTYGYSVVGKWLTTKNWYWKNVCSSFCLVILARKNKEKQDKKLDADLAIVKGIRNDESMNTDGQCVTQQQNAKFTLSISHMNSHFKCTDTRHRALNDESATCGRGKQETETNNSKQRII